MRSRRMGALLVVSMLGASLAALGAAPAAAVMVSDEAGFRTAWSDASETEIDLANDIVLTNCVAGEPTRISATTLTITGNGHTIRQTCAGQRVLAQNSSGALTFDGVTVTGGNTPSNAAGIFSAGGPVTLTNSTVSDNTAATVGGVRAESVTLTNATINGNTSTTGPGGGIGAPSVTLTNSSVWGNIAGDFGGGIVAETVTLTASTVSDNAAGIGGGGIGAESVTLTNSTVSGNTAGSFAGGIAAHSATVVYGTVVSNSSRAEVNLGVDTALTAFGSVVALPQGGGLNCAGGPATSNGFNFSDDASCGFTATSDRQNAGDPELGALASNGGPTQTQLPQAGSPLVDAIPVASCQAGGASSLSTDQRGVARPQGTGCDTGAVEVEMAPPPALAPAAPVAAVARFTG